MGFEEYDRVPETEIPFDPGDLLLVYTDGLTERFNPADQLYGEKRLLGIIQNQGAGSAGDLCREVVVDLEHFAEGRPADDDQAFVAVKRLL